MPTTVDAELDMFRQTVSCAAVLERMSGGWALDPRESTRQALKYRRGPGEVIIVNHNGRGWWEATGTAKGDVFNLVQHLDPSLNFGQVRQVLRRYVGVTPSYPVATKHRGRAEDDRSPATRWASRYGLRPGDTAWAYLHGQRALPATILQAAARQDCIRRGAYGSAWFAHRWNGDVSHVEIRNATFKGSLRGGRKTLFCFGAAVDDCCRLAILEAPIDALSLAAIENARSDTLYVATGGGMGPGTLESLHAILPRLALRGGVVVSGADANPAGDRFAERHAALATEAKVRFERARPPNDRDWNDVLVAGRGT